MTTPLDKLESNYPVVALRCHDLVEQSRAYLMAAGEKIARQSATVPKPADYVRTLPNYYAKLHSVTGLPAIFLSFTRAMFSATDDIGLGLWGIDVVEAALAVALDPVAVAAVEAGIAAAGLDAEPDAAVYAPCVMEGAQLVAAAVFDTALVLIEQ